MWFRRKPISNISLVCGRRAHDRHLRQGCLCPRAPERLGQGPQFLTESTIRFYREGSRRPEGNWSHLRAARQGVEEVKEHKTGEGHRCGAWGTRLVFGDLEHSVREEEIQPPAINLSSTESPGMEQALVSRPQYFSFTRK